MNKDMTLYICNLLLMKIDIRELIYMSAELDDEGVYDNIGNSNSDFDCYLCPSCSTKSFTGENGEKKEDCLKEIVVPIAAAKELIKLWNSILKEIDSLTEYGIPLDNQELKGLLMEYLI